MGNNVVLVLLILYSLHNFGTHSAKIVQLNVPRNVASNTDVQMSCEYDMEGDELYSIKWYKEDAEIYRFTPKRNPSAIFFPEIGVNIDQSMSNDTHIYLKNVDEHSAGHYTCEVSTDGPAFLVIQEKKEMTVEMKADSNRKLYLKRFEVPSQAQLGSNVDLLCKYEANGKQLYSVKWYKDGREFYRFTPRDLPRNQKFPLNGFSVDLSKSNETTVHLNKLSEEASGVYKCEVSMDGPSFETVAGEATLKVTNDAGSDITRFEVPSRVSSGDDVSLICEPRTTGDQLYAVQWFKDGLEFYRYAPRSTPNKRVFRVPGINVDLQTSDDKKIHLKSMSKQSEGKYTCEVSMEGPLFSTTSRNGQIAVYEEPSHVETNSGKSGTIVSWLLSSCKSLMNINFNIFTINLN